MSTKFVINCLSLSIFFISLFSVVHYIQASTGLPFSNTTIWWLINSFTLFVYFISKKMFYEVDNYKYTTFILLYLIWNVFSIFRGVFIADDYWYWKGLVANTINLLVPIVAYTASNKYIFQLIIRSYFKFTFPFFLVISFVIPKLSFGFYLVPVSFIAFFLPILSFRWKIIIIFVSLVVVFADFEARSNVIKFALPFLFLLIYFFRNTISYNFLEIFRKLIFIVPLLFFYLAIYDIFNIFEMSEYIENDITSVKINDQGEIIEANITADTRTFLYEEVLLTAKKHNSWWIGRSPARGNETEAFSANAEITGKAERLTNEAAILNTFTWTGIIGVMLFMLALYHASYLAMNYSNNIFSKMLSLFVAFRWAYAWVEDSNTYTLTNYFLWLIIGFCFSKSFRSMSNADVKFWILGIFDKRYIYNYK